MAKNNGHEVTKTQRSTKKNSDEIPHRQKAAWNDNLIFGAGGGAGRLCRPAPPPIDFSLHLLFRAKRGNFKLTHYL